MSGGYSNIEVKRNIRKLPTEELKTYENAYRKNQIHKYAREEAKAELKRRIKGKTLKKVIKKSDQFSFNDLMRM
jgi:hypothetical protein